MTCEGRVPPDVVGGAGGGGGAPGVKHPRQDVSIALRPRLRSVIVSARRDVGAA